MKKQIKCLRCGCTKLYSVRREKKRCSHCRYEWKWAVPYVLTHGQVIPGVAAKGYVHRLVRHHKGEYSDGKGNHINGLEGFWGYLKRRLTAKGGIRKERLPLYLAEYVWRYNHRNDSIQIQKKLILKQLERHQV